jgi:hypothetical protein
MSDLFRQMHGARRRKQITILPLDHKLSRRRQIAG